MYAFSDVCCMLYILENIHLYQLKIYPKPILPIEIKISHHIESHIPIQDYKEIRQNYIIPNMPIKKSEIVRAVIVRTRKEFKRNNGSIIKFDDNAAVVINQEGNPKGTRVFGPIARELREASFTKIVSLAPEVL